MAWLAILWGVLGVVGMSGTAFAHEAGAATYVRHDSDRTLVVSPRAFASAQALEPVRVDAAYVADIWTSASIDIRTGATPRVQETRHELKLRGELDTGATQGSVGYRYSAEHDYWSHGIAFEVQQALANNNARLSIRGGALLDSIGQVGDATFARDLTTLSVRLRYYQVLTANTWVQLAAETRYLNGYQASPYRSVGIGGTGRGCDESALCLREAVPEERLQQAAAVTGRHALNAHFSLGGEYRFFLDDWGMRAHTLAPHISWLVGPRSTLTLRYRYHRQGGADFYRERYTDLPRAGFVSRDRELSRMRTHRLGLDGTHLLAVAAHSLLELGLSLGLVRYAYPNFVGLSQVYAVESSAAVSLSF